MAITGSGTEQDPYIVHDYTELRTACNNINVFVELANDIDCNSYGENFEWETVYVLSNTQLDLKAHTVKNFKVKNGNRTFAMVDGVVRNGKILNVYLSDSQGFCSNQSNRGLFENLSISINMGSGIYGYVFDKCDMNACAIYVEGILRNQSDGALFNTLGESYPISNCDILLNITNANGCFIDYGYARSTKTFRNCRIRGTFENAQAGYLFYNTGTHNSVIDLINSNTGSLSSWVANCTGVINTDKLKSDFSKNGMTGVTSQEIINGDALRAKGFDVINVVGG